MENPSIKTVNQKDFTDDIWYEIFLRFPFDSIYRFRCVSKVWFSILSNPNFINKWYELYNSLLPWGFLHNFYEQKDSNPPSIIQFSYPDLYSRFVSDLQNVFSFRFLYQIVDRGVHPLTSSNGLIFCTTRIFYQTSYFVCNPLTQKWVTIPPPPEICRAVSGFICNECFSEPASFEVIRVPKFEDAMKEFKVEIFSSDLGEWNVYSVSCAEDVTWKFFVADNYVTHNGVFYWFQTINNIIVAISVNRNTNHGTCGNECKLINLPDRSMGNESSFVSRYLGESEGLICYALVKYAERSLTLSVWALDGDWYALHKDIKLNDWLAEIKSRLFDGLDEEYLVREMGVESFSPVDKNVVILVFEDYVWAYNIITRVYEQLCHPSFPRSSFPSVPHLRTIEFVLKPRPTILPPVSWSDT